MRERAGTADGGAPWSRFSPGFRLGLLFVLLVACCAADVLRPVPAATVAALAVASAALARVPLRTALLRLAPLASFSVIAFVLILFVPIGPDTPTVQLPVLDRSVPAHSLVFVGHIVIKAVLVVLIVTAFSQILDERAFLEGLIGLRLPQKVTGITYLIVRQLRTVRDEVARLIRGRDSRGKPRGLRAISVAGSMTQTLLVRLAQRAETQALALTGRGFAGRLVIMRPRTLSAAELLLLITALAGLLWIVLV